LFYRLTVVAIAFLHAPYPADASRRLACFCIYVTFTAPLFLYFTACLASSCHRLPFQSLIIPLLDLRFRVLLLAQDTQVRRSIGFCILKKPLLARNNNVFIRWLNPVCLSVPFLHPSPNFFYFRLIPQSRYTPTLGGTPSLSRKPSYPQCYGLSPCLSPSLIADSFCRSSESASGLIFYAIYSVKWYYRS
jgi:hypothetical protein